MNVIEAMRALPVYCVDCGAYLAGSWTQHRPGCGILLLIEKCQTDLGIAPDKVPEDIREHLESLARGPE
jgi:hypothetical protein